MSGKALALRRGAGLNELTESIQKVTRLRAYSIIHNLAIFVEDFMRSRYQQAPAEPRTCAERAKHGQPLSLRQRRAEAAGRSADECYGVIAEEGLNLSRRARSPVNRV